MGGSIRQTAGLASVAV